MWELLVFVLLVVVPVLLSLREVPARLRDLRAGLRGLAYVPALLAVLFAAAAGAWLLAQRIPLLQWGWLGSNVIAAPLTDLAPQPEGAPVRAPGGGDGGGSDGILADLLGPVGTLAVFVPFILLAFVVFNYYEEAYYRDSLRDVAVWAVLHLLMGIPVFAVLPIFAAGLCFKAIRDRRGLRTAYAAHLGMNVALLSVLVATILLGPAVQTGAV